MVHTLHVRSECSQRDEDSTGIRINISSSFPPFPPPPSPKCASLYIDTTGYCCRTNYAPQHKSLLLAALVSCEGGPGTRDAAEETPHFGQMAA